MLKMYESYGTKNLVRSQMDVSPVHDEGEENQVINIYPEIRYQVFEGFGGAITDAAGYIYSLMCDEDRERVINMYFDAANMDYQRVRIHMDSCDFSTHLYSAVTDEQDEHLDSFSFEDTEKYIIPMLNDSQKVAGKKLKIMLSAWSPPEFMKTNGNRKEGGSLKPEYRQRWAEYLCRYIQEFKNRGYDVERMSIQNEPKAVQTWDSCVYTAQEEKVFMRDYLYPQMQRQGLEDIEIFIWDHNKERLYERVRDIVDDQTDKMVSGAAFHWYSGDHFEALDLVRAMYPDKKLILSESCLEYNKYDKSTEYKNSTRLAHDLIGNLNHGMNAFYDWNILLDIHGGPNHVGNYCDAPFLYDVDKNELIYRRTVWYYWHFAHYIKPGAVRVATTCYTDSIDVTAWSNPDGSLAVVILNKSDREQTCNIRINGELYTFSIHGDAIISGIL